ncbi:MAG: urease accessory protein UreD [Vicinamibacterales bacterium]
MTTSTDVRATHDVGRKARLELVFGCRNGKTVLTHGYAEPPLRIGHCFESDRGLHLIMASSAPGIFGGDEFESVIRLEAGAVVELTSQSALQVHPSTSGGPARITSRYEIAAGADLRCSWEPLIPFVGSSVIQRFEVDVAEGSQLSWSDGLMSGRRGRGESWQFACVDHELRVRRAGVLAFLERYRVTPQDDDARSRWTVGDAGYIGTLVRAGHGDALAVAEGIHRSLAALGSVPGSADVLDGDLLLARIVAEDGVAFRRARRAVDSALLEAIKS